MFRHGYSDQVRGPFLLTKSIPVYRTIFSPFLLKRSTKKKFRFTKQKVSLMICKLEKKR